MFDKRIAEMTGSSITALSSSGGDCRMPLNLNDTDLNIHAKDPPQSYLGPTEMLFALCRIELIVAGGPGGNNMRPPNQPAQPGAAAAGASKNKPRVNYSPSPSSPDVVTQVANLLLPQNLDGFCNYIEAVYLKHCDAKIPLHCFTLMMTRQALCKLRIIDFMCRGVPTDMLEQPERDALFAEAIHMLEYDNLILGNDALRGFMWYMQMHFPFPAYIFLISEIRARRTGDLCDRAWDVMIENHERRGLIQTLRSPVHIAFGNMFIKAWDVREAAEHQAGRPLPTPKLITMLRQRMNRMAPNKRAAAPPAPSNNPQTGYQQQPGPSSNASSSSPNAGMGQPMNQAYTPEAAGPGPMNLDDNMMFPGFGGPNNMFGTDGGMNDGGQFGGGLDWTYLMQYSGFGGYGGGQQMGGNM
jgi:hypothetical protein